MKTFFPRKKIKLKVKDIQSPWIISGIKKFSKHKQCCMRIFCKLEIKKKNGLEYKNYKNLFEAIKKTFKESALFKIDC